MSSYPETIAYPGGFSMLSPAKINLFLRVLGKRADGFHEIETVFQEISLCDRLDFEESASWSLEIRGADLDPGRTNLVTRAAQILSQRAGVPCQGKVILHKQIPIGGGLGGGSSNAAIALFGLSRLWRLDGSAERLHSLAAELGSDCPFFLYGGQAVGRGRGERIEPLPGGLDGEIVLLIPPFGVKTAWAYQAGQFPLTDDEKSAILQFYPKRYSQAPLTGSQFRNDLENIVLSKYEELDALRGRLLALGAEVSLLSGSGSTIFGLFTDRDRALLAAQQFVPPIRVLICRAVIRSRDG